MSFSHERVGKWLLKWFEATDSLDVGQIGRFWIQDAVEIMGIGDQTRGRDLIVKRFGDTLATLEKMKHDVEFWDVAGNRVWTRMTVTLVLKDDPEHQRITVRAHPVFTLEEDQETGYKIREARICVDNAPMRDQLARLGAA